MWYFVISALDASYTSVFMLSSSTISSSLIPYLVLFLKFPFPELTHAHISNAQYTLKASVSLSCRFHLLLYVRIILWNKRSSHFRRHPISNLPVFWSTIKGSYLAFLNRIQHHCTERPFSLPRGCYIGVRNSGAASVMRDAGEQFEVYTMSVRKTFSAIQWYLG